MRGKICGIRVLFNTDNENWTFYNSIEHFAQENNFSPTAVANSFKYSNEQNNIFFLSKITNEKVNIYKIQKVPLLIDGVKLDFIKHIFIQALVEHGNKSTEEAEHLFYNNL